MDKEKVRRVVDRILEIRNHIDPELMPFHEIRNYVIPSKDTLPKMIAVYSDPKLLAQAENILMDTKPTGLEATVRRINWLDYMAAAMEFAQNPAHQSVRDAVERILLDSSYLQQKSTPDLKAMASDRIELFKEIVRTDPEWAKALLEKIPAGSTHRKVLENHVGYLSSVGVFRAER